MLQVVLVVCCLEKKKDWNYQATNPETFSYTQILIITTHILVTS